MEKSTTSYNMISYNKWQVRFSCFQRLCPERAASFLSKLTFSWFSPLARQGYRSPLKHHHLWHLNFEDTSKEVVPKFDKYWDALVHDKSL